MPEADYSVWLNTNASIVLVVERLPEKVACVEAPHVRWVLPSDFARMRAETNAAWVELPTCFHAPVGDVAALRVPRGRGVMMAVFDFDWVYMTKSDPDTPEEDSYRIPPDVARLENRLADRGIWVEACVRPSWSLLRDNVAVLGINQRRMLVGLSRVLGENGIVAEASPSCDWAQEMVDQDVNGNDAEEWLQTSDVPWHDKMPAYRWIRRAYADDDHIFQARARLRLRLKQNVMPWAFDRAFRLKNSHHFFTQECVEHFPPLTAFAGCEKGALPFLLDDPDFVPSSPGLVVCPENPRWYIVNNRKVNYRILSNGAYVTIRGGHVNPIYNGISRNEFFLMDRETLQPVSPIRPMSEDAVPNKREEEVAIVGLEDVRLVREGVDGGALRFYATTKSHSYSDAIRIMTGRYDVERALFCGTQVIHPPYDENPCEKNWAWCGDDRYIYKWHPVEIGSVRGDRLVIDEHLPSPAYFREFRGSSPGVAWRGHTFFTVHSVAQREDGRKYAHSLVVLDLSSGKHCVVGATPPFCFEDVQIEYSIGLDIHDGKILFLYSTRDSTSRYMRVPAYHLLDQLRFVDGEAEARFKMALYASDW